MKNHRKLFPALAATNQSIDCSYFCDQTCPYNCYPDTDYYLPPPPPQQPLSSSLLPREHRISPFVIILVSVLASFFLLVSYYIITSKSCPNWLSNNNRRRQGDRGREADDNDDHDTEDHEEGNINRIDHPIWLITTAGLQQTIINSITVCKYKKGEGLIEGTECSVCLSEFQQDESLRLLPKCNHAFHIPCIDTWLMSHTNCPLCRAHILLNDPPANRNPENLSTGLDTHVENPEIDSDEPCQNRDGAGDAINCDIQTMRRSLSMDSLRETTLYSCPSPNNIVDPVDEKENRGIDMKNEGGKMGSSSITRHLHKSPVAMKRSFSHGGRQNRNLNAILPL